MADPKKNPLIGAFHSPSPGDPPSDKPGEDKKPAEPPKEVKDPAAPVKPGEEKKPTEAPLAGKEEKPAEGEKKAPEGSKAPSSPAKPDEAKNPTEPPKDDKKQKPTEDEIAMEDKGEELTRGQKAALTRQKNEAELKRRLEAIEDKKADKAQKPAEGEKKTPEGKAPADSVKPGEEKKPDGTPKGDGERKPDESEEIPADFHLDIVSKDNLGSVTMIPLVNIDDFEGHPFPVRDDKDMEELVASIKQVGLLEPATIIRNPKKPGRFEMVAGHRRKHAALLAGLTHIPAIVRDMDHDEATIYMVDSNLKREKITPMPICSQRSPRPFPKERKAAFPSMVSSCPATPWKRLLTICWPYWMMKMERKRQHHLLYPRNFRHISIKSTSRPDRTAAPLASLSAQAWNLVAQIPLVRGYTPKTPLTCTMLGKEVY